MNAATRRILLVEDCPADILFVQDALANASLPFELHVVFDGTEALAFLRKEPPFGGAPPPELLLVDLRMPLMGGVEFLTVIRQSGLVPSVPKVVLSGSPVRRRSRARCAPAP